MKVFVDCDVAVKLAQWGVLTRFHTLLSRTGGADVFTVETLKYKFKLRSPAQAQQLVGSSTAVEQLTAFVNACRRCSDPDQALANALQEHRHLDAGEVAILACAARYDAALVNTGDKKALRALGEISGLEALYGKLACLEQTMDHLAHRWTYISVRQAVHRHPGADTAVHECVKSPDETVGRSALKAKIEDLRRDCAQYLSATPFAWID